MSKKPRISVLEYDALCKVGANPVAGSLDDTDLRNLRYEAVRETFQRLGLTEEIVSGAPTIDVVVGDRPVRFRVSDLSSKVLGKRKQIITPTEYEPEPANVADQDSYPQIKGTTYVDLLTLLHHVDNSNQTGYLRPALQTKFHELLGVLGVTVSNYQKEKAYRYKLGKETRFLCLDKGIEQYGFPK